MKRGTCRDDAHITLRRQRRVSGERADERDVSRATLGEDARRTRLTAIDAAIEDAVGHGVMSAGEVVDLLLDLRARVVFSEMLTDA